MKKLILTATVALASVASQAASVKWSSNKLYTAADAKGGFSTTAIKNAATTYLFTLTATEYAGFLEAYNSSGDMSKVWDTYKDSLGSATVNGKSSSLSSVVNLSTPASVDETVYGAIIYTYTDANLGQDFYIANIAAGTVGSDAGITLGNLGTYFLGANASTGTSTGGWQSTAAVPEPTSGLLMLVGLAGLALRRKRA